METMLWIIYWVGVVICPILFGMLFGRKMKNNPFAFGDVYVPLALLSILWPMLVVLLISIGVVVLVCIAIGGMWMALSEIGRLIGTKVFGIDDDDELENEDE